MNFTEKELMPDPSEATLDFSKLYSDKSITDRARESDVSLRINKAFDEWREVERARMAGYPPLTDRSEELLKIFLRGHLHGL